MKREKWRKCSQAGQDMFASDCIGMGGTYIEIGGHLPRKRSNTYNLEVLQNWKGFSIEFDMQYKSEWDNCPQRKNPIYWGDAITFNYKNALEDLNMPKHINYLSIDIEPPENTFKALQKVISDGITFDVITFEHDRYQCEEDYHTIACNYLIPLGYKVAVRDVWHKVPTRIFETWFVKEDIPFAEVDYDTWFHKRRS